jgi:hypothetical protein
MPGFRQDALGYFCSSARKVPHRTATSFGYLGSASEKRCRKPDRAPVRFGMDYYGY